MQKAYHILTFIIISMLLQYSSFSQGFTWAKSFGLRDFWDEVYGMTTDKEGNIYITGNFTGNTDFDPGAGSFYMNASGREDIYILKLDKQGDFLWAKQLVNSDPAITSQNFRANSITADESGYLYLAGWFKNSVDFDPGTNHVSLTATDQNVFVLKLDSYGNFTWVKQINSTERSLGYSITLDTPGNIYLGGIFIGTSDFDPGPGVNNLTAAASKAWDGFVLKLDNAGNFIWVKQIEGDDIRVADIVIGKDQKLYITGTLDGTADMDPGAALYPITGNTCYVMKMDSSGAFLWAKPSLGGFITVDNLNNVYASGPAGVQKNDSSGNEIWIRHISCNPTGITTDKSGNVLMAGYFSGTTDFDPGTAAYNLSSNGLDDMFILKLDSGGKFTWCKAIGGSGQDGAAKILADKEGNAYITGMFSGDVDFDTDSGKYYLSSSHYTDEDIFVMKLAYNNVGIKKPELRNKITISPNPVKDKISIRGVAQISTICIKDMQGKLIKKIENPGNEVEVPGIPKGMYLLQIEIEDERYTLKVLKE